MATNSLQINSLRFITGIRFFKDTLDKINNITYVYDKNWDMNNSNKTTFPVCFFHVKSCHEAMTSEVSQKQMLFYNSASEETPSDPSLNSGLLNVVADNIVIKPKVYKLDVIIPYKELLLIDSSMAVDKMNSVIKYMYNATNYDKGATKTAFSAWALMSAPYMQFVKNLIMNLTGLSYSSVRDWVSGVVQQPDFNKQSLEMMWKLRHIVKMKMWNSWEYKYVSIIDVDISKEGTEDGVYEATLTLQEMPIVTMYGKDETRGVNGRLNKIEESNTKTLGDRLKNAGDQFKSDLKSAGAELKRQIKEAVGKKQDKNPLLKINCERVIKELDEAGGDTKRKWKWNGKIMEEVK